MPDQAARVARPVVVGAAARCGDRVEVGPQPGCDVVEDHPPKLRGAVCARADREPGGASGLLFLGQEQQVILRLGDLGGDQLEHPATEQP